MRKMRLAEVESAIQDLNRQGLSVWLDYDLDKTRRPIGELRVIAEDHVLGIVDIDDRDTHLFFDTDKGYPTLIKLDAQGAVERQVDFDEFTVFDA